MEQPNQVQVYFTLERVEAEWLAEYLQRNTTTLSEKMRLAVLDGLRKFRARERSAELEAQIEQLRIELASLSSDPY